jgi:hypothetical protein
MIIIGMSDNIHVNKRRESFIGSMAGTMEIIGDILAPIDVQWEADAATDANSPDPAP